MIFKDFVNSLQESVENAAQAAVVEQPARVSMPCELIPQFDPSVWTCRKLNGSEYYAFYGGHAIDVTKLRRAISNLYAAKGYLGQGFSKLTEPQLMTYATTKNILKRVASTAFRVELDADEVASYLFNCENFDFTRE